MIAKEWALVILNKHRKSIATRNFYKLFICMDNLNARRSKRRDFISYENFSSGIESLNFEWYKCLGITLVNIQRLVEND